MSERPAAPPGEEVSLGASIERGLDHPLLDEQAFVRIRTAAWVEFESLHARRARRLGLWRFPIAAALVLATVLLAILLRMQPDSVSAGTFVRIDGGSLQWTSRWPLDRQLEIGESVPVGERFWASGTALIALPGRGTLRVSPGTQFETARANELSLQSGRAYFDFPKGSQPFLVRTAKGTIEHVGTQFEVQSQGERFRIRVREGTVRVHDANGMATADAGTELIVADAGTVVRQAVPTYGPDWAWVEAIAPDFDIDNRPLTDFLDWVARETGRHIDFADSQTREVAARTVLHGSVHGLAPLQALERVLDTTTLRCEIHEDAIRITAGR